MISKIQPVVCNVTKYCGDVRAAQNPANCAHECGCRIEIAAERVGIIIRCCDRVFAWIERIVHRKGLHAGCKAVVFKIADKDMLHVFQLPTFGPFEAGIRRFDELEFGDTRFATDTMTAFKDVQGEESLQVEIIDQRLFDEAFGIPRAEPCGNFRIVGIHAANASVHNLVAVEECTLAVKQSFLTLENSGRKIVVLHQVANHDREVVSRAECHDALAHNILIRIFPVGIACGIKYCRVATITASGGNRVGHLPGFHDKGRRGNFMYFLFHAETFSPLKFMSRG